MSVLEDINEQARREASRLNAHNTDSLGVVEAVMGCRSTARYFSINVVAVASAVSNLSSSMPSLKK
jgi:hypothetical protein